MIIKAFIFSYQYLYFASMFIIKSIGIMFCKVYFCNYNKIYRFQSILYYNTNVTNNRWYNKIY